MTFGILYDKNVTKRHKDFHPGPQVSFFFFPPLFALSFEKVAGKTVDESCSRRMFHPLRASSRYKIQLWRPHEVSVIGHCFVNKQHTPQITGSNWNKHTGPAAFRFADLISQMFGPCPFFKAVWMMAE